MKNRSLSKSRTIYLLYAIPLKTKTLYEGDPVFYKKQHFKKSVLSIAVLLTTSAANATDIVIFDGMLNPLAGVSGPGVRVLNNGNKVGSVLKRLFVSDDAYAADRNLRATHDFYLRNFNRNSFDGYGARIEATVRIGKLPIDLFGFQQNAAWNGKRFLFGDGSSMGIKNLTDALDVTAHEYTHAVVQYTSRLEYQGQSGALNEHFADLFGEMAQQEIAPSINKEKVFLIGESILSETLKQKASEKRGQPVVALRDMMVPSRGLTPQPGHMSQIKPEYGPGCSPSNSNDLCGVHELSGIPNRASALIVRELGWARTKAVFYNVMTLRLKSNSQFQDYARELMGECYRQLSPNECAVMNNSLKEVGL